MFSVVSRFHGDPPLSLQGSTSIFSSAIPLCSQDRKEKNKDHASSGGFYSLRLRKAR